MKEKTGTSRIIWGIVLIALFALDLLHGLATIGAMTGPEAAGGAVGLLIAVAFIVLGVWVLIQGLNMRHRYLSRDASTPDRV